MSFIAEESPFEIPHEHVQMLCNDEGFQILRTYLARNANFCADHVTASSQTKETWLLHRDLLHALTMPIYQLFSRASTLASAALCTRAPEDLELAFSGEARGAFLCLQCFITEEEDWCQTKGCPACTTLATLSTESHIRLTIAASLLSTSPSSTPTSESPTQSASRSLPPLPHILPALRQALSSDPFWGPDTFDHILSRAEQLSAGIQTLIVQCVDLEALVSVPSTMQRNPGVAIKVGKVARRQQKMREEELDIWRRCAMQCWARAAVPSRVRGELLGRGERRRRSLTCP